MKIIIRIMLKIRRIYRPSSPYTGGKIENIKVFNRQLSVDEISQLNQKSKPQNNQKGGFV